METAHNICLQVTVPTLPLYFAAGAAGSWAKKDLSDKLAELATIGELSAPQQQQHAEAPAGSSVQG